MIYNTIPNTIPIHYILYSTRSLAYMVVCILYNRPFEKNKKMMFSRQRATAAVTADCSLVCSQNIYIIIYYIILHRIRLFIYIYILVLTCTATDDGACIIII